MTPQEIISEEEIIRVHGHANFGSMTPREVVNDGVRKHAVGFSSGHTQLCIMLEHRLITKPKPGSYRASLTQKGKRYARSIWKTHFALAAALDQDALAAMVREAERRGRKAALELAAQYLREKGCKSFPNDILALIDKEPQT